MVDQRVYTFGNKELIVEKLMKGYREGSDVKGVYERFAESMANSEKVAPGVNLGWELAVYDVGSAYGSVPMLGMMMGMLFKQVMTALLDDDPEFLNDVLEFRAEVLASIPKRGAE